MPSKARISPHNATLASSLYTVSLTQTVRFSCQLYAIALTPR